MYTHQNQHISTKIIFVINYKKTYLHQVGLSMWLLKWYLNVLTICTYVCKIMINFIHLEQPGHEVEVLVA
jgi:hypothetical protein